MCPLCIGTATLLVSSGTSAGGLTALLLRRLVHRRERLARLKGPVALQGDDRELDREDQRSPKNARAGRAPPGS
jgi:hypothetical protein